jgi:G:T-mismatch repair DNA endonuclease (very short patch repair protein)
VLDFSRNTLEALPGSTVEFVGEQETVFECKFPGKPDVFDTTCSCVIFIGASCDFCVMGASPRSSRENWREGEHKLVAERREALIGSKQ